MRGLVLLPVLLCAAASAQNWALLNPTYKYNYSNDGSDTISNQIFVTHIDTLGVDSFRYELNRIARTCNTCGDTCNVQVNLQQFLEGECHSSSTSFTAGTGPGLIIHTRAAQSASWIFDPLNGTSGGIVSISEELVIDAMDSVRTMTSALNDTVRWSKAHGIVKWRLHNGSSYDLIGIQGADAGQLIPTLSEFFPFSVGDVVQFRSGGGNNGSTWSYVTKWYIEERTESPDQLTFSGYTLQKVTYDGGASYYSYGPGQWVVDSVGMPAIRAIYTAPQELVTIPATEDVSLYAIVKHHVDSTGSYVIEGEQVQLLISLFTTEDIPGDECVQAYSPGFCSTHLVINDRLGVKELSYCLDNYMSSYFGTIGAVINGDTVGTLFDDEYFHVGISEPLALSFAVLPNPATDHIALRDVEPGGSYVVVDAQGRRISTGLLSPSRTIDVEHLEPGNYVLLMEGYAPQRFIIAR